MIKFIRAMTITADLSDEVDSDRMHAIYELIRSHEPDVITIQKGRRWLAERLPPSLPRYVCLPGKQIGTGELNVICFDHYRITKMNDGFDFVSPNNRNRLAYGAMHECGINWAILRDDETGVVFLVASVQLDSLSKNARMHGIRYVKRVIKRNGPIQSLIMGEWNWANEKEALDSGPTPKTRLCEANLSDAVISYRRMKGLQPLLTATYAYQYLDAIYTDFEVLCAEVLPQTIAITGKEVAYSNGHCAVQALLRIPTA